jgi:pimeloyl-ACP methyl ester carboxylesterase
MRTGILFAVSLGLVVACGKKKEEPKPAEAPAPVAEAPKPPPTPTPSEEATFASKDGIPLFGTYYDAGDDAPLLVFIHRFRGESTEWKPFVDRMAQREPRYSMVNFDLRGHGRSASASGKQRLDWSTIKDTDMPDLVLDVHAAIQYGLEKSEGKASGVVLAGSSLGAALAAAAAGEEPRVTAVALVSPGAAINRFEIYRPFADVRMLPAFLAGSAEDNVSKEPLEALGRMGREAATIKRYPGTAHGAVALLAGGSGLADDLETWLMAVYDDKPMERPIRELADGKKKPAKKGK